MAVVPDRALPAGLDRLANTWRRRNVARHLGNLEYALQNYPLQRLQEQARGKAIESEVVDRVETRATRAVLVELRELTKLAEAIPNRADRPPIFLEALPILSRALVFRNGEWSVRQATVRILGCVWGDSQVVPLLEYIMNDSRAPVVCRAAAGELAQIGGMEAVESLTRALGHEDTGVREIATSALENKQMRRFSVRALERALRHRDPRVRRRAADVLDHIDWKPGDEDLQAWYAVAKQEWDVAAKLDDHAVAALENALRGEISQVRRQAAAVLDSLEWDPSPYAVRGWYLVAKQEWDVAVRLRLSAGLPLANALLDGEPAVRDSARKSLLELGIDAVPALVTTLHDSENSALVRTASILLGTVARTMPDQAKERIPERFADAVGSLTAAITHPHRPIIIEAATALAEIAENIPDRTEVARLFDPIEETLAEIASNHHGVARHDLDSVRIRIHRARTGTLARPVPKFLTFVWRRGTLHHKVTK